MLMFSVSHSPSHSLFSVSTSLLIQLLAEIKQKSDDGDFEDAAFDFLTPDYFDLMMAQEETERTTITTTTTTITTADNKDSTTAVTATAATATPSVMVKKRFKLRTDTPMKSNARQQQRQASTRNPSNSSSTLSIHSSSSSSLRSSLASSLGLAVKGNNLAQSDPGQNSSNNTSPQNIKKHRQQQQQHINTTPRPQPVVLPDQSVIVLAADLTTLSPIHTPYGQHTQDHFSFSLSPFDIDNNPHNYNENNENGNNISVGGDNNYDLVFSDPPVAADAAAAADKSLSVYMSTSSPSSSSRINNISNNTTMTIKKSPPSTVTKPATTTHFKKKKPTKKVISKFIDIEAKCDASQNEDSDANCESLNQTQYDSFVVEDASQITVISDEDEDEEIFTSVSSSPIHHRYQHADNDDLNEGITMGNIVVGQRRRSIIEERKQRERERMLLLLSGGSKAAGGGNDTLLDRIEGGGHADEEEEEDEEDYFQDAHTGKSAMMKSTSFPMETKKKKRHESHSNNSAIGNQDIDQYEYDGFVVPDDEVEEEESDLEVASTTKSSSPHNNSVIVISSSSSSSSDEEEEESEDGSDEDSDDFQPLWKSASKNISHSSSKNETFSTSLRRTRVIESSDEEESGVAASKAVCPSSSNTATAKKIPKSTIYPPLPTTTIKSKTANKHKRRSMVAFMLEQKEFEDKEEEVEKMEEVVKEEQMYDQENEKENDSISATYSNSSNIKRNINTNKKQLESAMDEVDRISRRLTLMDIAMNTSSSSKSSSPPTQQPKSFLDSSSIWNPVNQPNPLTPVRNADYITPKKKDKLRRRLVDDAAADSITTTPDRSDIPVTSINYTPSAVEVTLFKKTREGMTRTLFAEFNQRVFDGQLDADMEIKWSVHLSKTAGRTHCLG